MAELRTTNYELRTANARAFSLMEILVAIGIFAIGMVTVASIFPVAILLQKETVNTVESKHFANSTEALVKTIGFTAPQADWDAVDNEGNPGDGVSAIPNAAFNAWAWEDRSYNTIDNVTSRQTFWVPMVIDTDPDPATQVWEVYLFVVRARQTGTYDKSAGTWANASDPDTDPGIPGIVRINVNASAGYDTTIKGSRMQFTNSPRIVFAGDQVLDQNGVTYVVRRADDDGIYVNGLVPGNPANLDIWAAHPGDQTTTSFVRLIQLLDKGTGTDSYLIRTP